MNKKSHNVTNSLDTAYTKRGEPMSKWKIFLGVFLGILIVDSAFAKVVRYELTANRIPMNLSGKKEVDFAISVNGQIPAPTLTFTEGDEAEIVVRNNLDEELSIHWHGILLPPLEDGVAYVNTPPIFAGKERTFRFKLRQNGTYWYHSHTMVQEQKGVYGAIVIHPQKPLIKADKEAVAVLSDWSDENADKIIRNLRKDGDYYLYKKNSIRSYFGALKAGALGNHLKNEWSRMGGMDLSDVGYDAFLINGKRDAQLVTAHPGDRVRIRVINAAASSYFYVSLGGLPFQVVSADGVDIEPVWTKEILMGMAETYDILFTVPEHKNYELRATCQDVTGYASAWIGMGEKVSASTKPMPDMYATMDHAGHDMSAMGGMSSMDHSQMGHSGHDMSGMDHSKMNHSSIEEANTKENSEKHTGHDMKGMDHSKMNHSQMDHSKHGSMKSVDAPEQKATGPVVETLTVDELKAKESTTLPPKAPKYDVKLVLGGDMERYVWHINNKAISEDRNIIINEGDVVRFTFVNETMMHHPMHLHGHFFRVLNKNGDRSPLKHTVDVPPHGTRTIEFYANEPGEWMLHCHNLYHMKTGMARVVKYSTFKPSKEIEHWQHHDPHNHEHIYFTGMLEAATNHGKAEFKAMRTWDVLDLEVETRKEDHSWEVEGDLLYKRYFDNWFYATIGGTSFESDQRAVAGVGYILPMLFDTQLLVDQKGKFRFEIEKRFQWTSKILSDAELTIRQNKKPEWEVSLMYAPNWSWAAGIMLTEEKLGAGVQWRF